MLFDRSKLNALNSNLSSGNYTPVLLSGVRGCGKTTLAGQFAQRFAQTMLFDLSETSDRQVFEKIPSGGLHFHDLYLFRNRDPNGGRTLLFVDNVQDAEWVWRGLAAMGNRPGNLFLLGATDKAPPNPPPEGGGHAPLFKTPLPDGGVLSSSLVLHPSSFAEFLTATGEKEALSLYLETPCPDHAHHRLLGLFHRYVMTGGMPAAVNAWAEDRNMVKVEKAFDQVLAGWDQLIREHSGSRKGAVRASTLFADAFPYAAERISFRNFANRPVRSRESAGVFRFLQQLMLLDLIYPVTGTDTSAQPDTGRSPRLQFADTGMAVYLSGIRHTVASSVDLTQLVGGQVLRHVVGQEVSTKDEGRRTKDEGSGTWDVGPRTWDVGSKRPSFWVSGNPQSHAEVDFVLGYEDLLIPVVTRAGEPGRLRSLHSFLDQAPHPFAVRLCADRLNVRKADTVRGKPFYLLSLPYYLAARIPEHLEGFMRYVTR